MNDTTALDDTEGVVISALLQGGRSAIDAVTLLELSPQDFADARLGLIYSAIMALSAEGVDADPVTVAHQLSRVGKLGVAGGKENIAWLIDLVPTAANVSYHATIVREHGRRRHARSELLALARQAGEGTTPLPSLAAKIGRLADSLGVETEHEPAAGLRIESLSNIAMEPVRWLWPNYLPIGKIVTVDGFPGQGKSTLMLDIAARLSRGSAMPDGSGGGAPVNTLILTYEDDPADTLVPRLAAAGADSSRVAHVQGVAAHRRSTDLTPASLPRDIVALETALRQNPDIRLVFIDPLSAALGADVDSHKDQDVRRALSRLARMAAECAVCVALIRHVRKSHGGNAVTAGGGSIGIIGQARVGLLVERHPEMQDASVLAVVKSNVGPIAPSLTFRKSPATVTSTISGEEIQTSRLQWLGGTHLTADELLSSRDDAADEGHDAVEWLRQVLSGGARVERKNLMQMAVDSGFHDRTIDRAAKRLGVKKERVGFGPECRAIWRLDASSSATSATSAQREELAELAEVSGHVATRDPAKGHGILRPNGVLIEPGSPAEKALVARIEAEMRLAAQPAG